MMMAQTSLPDHEEDYLAHMDVKRSVCLVLIPLD